MSQKKLDPFLFEHNFGKYWWILIILWLLQTVINCDQVLSPKPKSANMIKNLLADVAGMIS